MTTIERGVKLKREKEGGGPEGGIVLASGESQALFATRRSKEGKEGDQRFASSSCGASTPSPPVRQTAKNTVFFSM